jgi:hypothetical protein
MVTVTPTNLQKMEFDGSLWERAYVRFPLRRMERG